MQISQVNSRLSVQVLKIMFLLLLALSVLAQTLSENSAKAGKKIATDDLILLNFTVKDEKGQYMSSLTKEQIFIFTEDKPQPILYFNDSPKPPAIVFLIDKSRFMKTGTKKTISFRESINHLIKLGAPKSEYSVISFNSTPRLRCGWTADIGNIEKSLAEMDIEDPQGSASLYNACHIALKQAQGSLSYRRVIIALTNGVNHGSGIDINELKRAVLETNTMLFVIDVEKLIQPFKKKWIATSSQGGSFAEEVDKLEESRRREFFEVSIQSGGRWFKVNDQVELTTAIEQIANELKHQYVIGFQPTLGSDVKKLYRIRINLATGTSAWYRKGYYLRTNNK